MKSKTLFTGFFLASLLTVATAQPGAPGGAMPGMDNSLLKIFGNHTAFSAKADMRISDKSGQENMSMAADFSVLDGKVCTEVDLSQMKGRAMPPEALAQMKQMGMDRVVSIMRPDQKKLLLIYPGLKSYASAPIPDNSVADNRLATEKTELGKETIDGHPCVKNRQVVIGDDGQKHEFTVWNASDLKDFPVQFEANENGMTLRGKYHDIELTKPDAKKFEPPPGFKSYDSVEAMMTTVMQQMMEKNAPKTPQGVPGR